MIATVALLMLATLADATQIETILYVQQHLRLLSQVPVTTTVAILALAILDDAALIGLLLNASHWPVQPRQV